MAISVDIPGWRSLRLEHLVLDLNGTVAFDGQLLPGVARAVADLSASLQCHLITADTYGTAGSLFGEAVHLQIISKGDEAAQKLDIIKKLGADKAVALGNGANDALMLAEAALGICVVSGEGACLAALNAADIAVTSPLDALGLLLNPSRLRATLRR